MNKDQLSMVRDAERARREQEKAAALEQEMTKRQDIMEESATLLSKVFAVTVAMLVAVCVGFSYQEWAKDVERNYFSEPDHCGTLAQQQNSSLYEYSLRGLSELGEVIIPETVLVKHVSNDEPSSWILDGDNMFYVEEGWWYVAVDTDMSGITGAMLREWFTTVNCSDMYRWWHPLDHVYGVWLDVSEYRATSDLVARQGKIHRVKEYINGELSKLDIIFQDPCVGRNCDALKEQGVELILSAQVTAHQTGVGRVHVGNFIHSLRVDDTGSTLHSRFTMGRDIHCIDNTESWSCYIFQSAAALLKRVLLSETKIRGIYRHCKEEMFVLGRLVSKLNSAPVA